MSDTSQQILDNAGKPAEAANDGQSMAQHPIPSQIAADRYAAAAAGVKKRNRGVMYSKLIPAGAMPDSQGTGQGGAGGFDRAGNI